MLTNYQRISLLGTGGMAKVYLAEDIRLKRKVAIKKIHHHIPDELVLHEGQMLAQLNHPHIVQLHDLVQENGELYLIMEYVQGQSLALYQSEHVLSLTEKIALLAQISRGLAAAHGQGILHCDLKPPNILIDSQHRVKITDFGIAQMAKKTPNPLDISGNSQTKNPNQVTTYGSQPFMSPEQLRGEKITPASDLFSFGILAFILLDDQHPFGTGSAPEIAGRILNQPPKNAMNLMPPLPAALITLINQLLNKEPTQRTISALHCQDVLEQLEKSLTRQAILEQETQAISTFTTKGSAFTNKRVHATSPSKGKRNRRIATIASLFFLMAVVLLLNVFPSDEPTYPIAVLPPQLAKQHETQLGKQLSTQQQELVVATLDSAINQTIINTPNMYLIPSGEIKGLSDSFEQLGKATGATDIITTKLDCDSESCNIHLSRLTRVAADNGQSWRVTLQKVWPMAINNYYHLFRSSQSQFASLYPEVTTENLKQYQTDEKDYFRYVNLYADIMLHGKYSDPALNELQQLAADTPYFYPVYTLLRELSLALFHKNRDNKYIWQLEKSLTNAPPAYKYSIFKDIDDFLILMATAEPAQITRQIERQLQMLKNRGVDNAQFVEFQARSLLAAGDYSAALQSYLQVLNLRQSTGVILNVAYCYFMIGNSQEAKRWLEKILSLTPKHSDAKQLLATVLLQQGLLDQAIPLFEAIVASHKRSDDIANLSLAYMLSKDYQQANKMAQMAVALSPKHPTLLLNLADSQQILGLTKQARDNYQKVINLHKEKSSLDAVIESAQAHIQLDEKHAAVTKLNQAKILAPESSEVAFTSALVYARLNEVVSAVVQVETSIAKSYGAIWFKLPWFDGLCVSPVFIKLMKKEGLPTRCDPGYSKADLKLEARS